MDTQKVVEAVAKDVLRNKVNNEESFTAYDITKEVRVIVGSDVEVEHKVVKELVHQCFYSGTIFTEQYSTERDMSLHGEPWRYSILSDDVPDSSKFPVDLSGRVHTPEVINETFIILSEINNQIQKNHAKFDKLSDSEKFKYYDNSLFNTSNYSVGDNWAKIALDTVVSSNKVIGASVGSKATFHSGRPGELRLHKNVVKGAGCLYGDKLIARWDGKSIVLTPSTRYNNSLNSEKVYTVSNRNDLRINVRKIMGSNYQSFNLKDVEINMGQINLEFVAT